MTQPQWSPERRAKLIRALRKAQAGSEQGERVSLTGDEATLLYKAAQCWEDMMTMLDEAARDGKLDGIKP